MDEQYAPKEDSNVAEVHTPPESSQPAVTQETSNIENPQAPEPASTGDEGIADNVAAVPMIIYVFGFIIITLLSVLTFHSLLAPKTASDPSKSAGYQSLQADMKSRRSEINRARIELGLEPLVGSDLDSETAEEISSRLKGDADTLASLVGSIQSLLANKDQKLDEVRMEAVTALNEQKRLRDLLAGSQEDLRRALADAALAGTFSEDLKKAKIRIESLEDELVRARQKLQDNDGDSAQLRRDNDELRREIAALRNELEQLRAQQNKTQLFAGSEEQMLADARRLYQALQRLEGTSPEALTDAYSRLGAELSATVLKTCTFPTGSSDIDEALSTELNSIPTEVPSEGMIFIVGYASKTGNEESNRKLSSDRATAVAEILDTVKRPQQKVQAAYLGQTDRFSKTDRQPNQIVEIWQILPKEN